ncbi:MAG: glycine--tRNA ligase subunit beta [bacterium]
MNFLLEIGTEEIPALWIDKALEQLKNKAQSFLENEGIAFKSIKTYGTPRRLTLIINGIGIRQKEKEIIGPPANSFINGFLKAHGVKKKELFVKEIRGKRYYCLIKKGKETKEVIKNVIADVIKGITFPKQMRWKTHLTFARPIRWIVALLDNEIIEFECAGVISSNKTRSLRIKKEPVVIPNPSSYISILKEQGIIVDCKERKDFILKKIKEEADKLKAKPFLKEELLLEITNLVESPLIIRCSFNKRYLKIPDDVIIASLTHHQRYVPLIKKKGIISYFLVVSNGGEKGIITKGHNRVVSARLSDAEFFFKEDLKIPLEQFGDRLKGVIFHKGLGSLYDKTMRNVSFSVSLGLRLIEEKRLPELSKAAFLCKADLTTQMVQEFPELQGIMGYHYAMRQGIPKTIASAIREHYLILPKSKLARIINLADRMDTLTGYFSLGIIPKGGEDPYGLRRCGNSIIKIILSSNFKKRVFLESLIRESCRIGKIKDEDRITEEILLFIRQRLVFIFKEKYFTDAIDAVLSLGFDDIVDCEERIKALSFFIKEDADFIDLSTSFKRVVNILKGAKRKEFDYNLLLEDAEKRLYFSLIEAKKALEDTVSKRDYREGFKILASLRPDIDKFFDGVMVMVSDKDIRENRLSLLFLLKDLFFTLADISVIRS